MANPIPGAYRIRYSVWVDWMGPGAGPMLAASAPMSGQKGGGAGMQTKEVSNTPNYPGTTVCGTGSFTNPQGTVVNQALGAADITSLTNAMAADIAAQLNASPTFSQLQNFVIGGG